MQSESGGFPTIGPPPLEPAISPSVHLSLTIAYITLYGFLFIFIYIQLWLILFYKHKRFSYQTVFLGLSSTLGRPQNIIVFILLQQLCSGKQFRNSILLAFVLLPCLFAVHHTVFISVIFCPGMLFIFKSRNNSKCFFHNECM